jgi:hypothetical protein
LVELQIPLTVCPIHLRLAVVMTWRTIPYADEEGPKATVNPTTRRILAEHQ